MVEKTKKPEEKKPAKEHSNVVQATEKKPKTKPVAKQEQEKPQSPKISGKWTETKLAPKQEKNKPQTDKKKKPHAEKKMILKKEKKQQQKPLPATAFTTGKRKRAIARASIKPGKGIVKVNTIPLEYYQSDMLRLKMFEPLIIAGDPAKKFNINVTVRGGGSMGQAEATRQAIAKGLVKVLGPELKKTYSDYDRNLIAFDPRRTEPHKPPRSSQGPRRYKQRSKR